MFNERATLEHKLHTNKIQYEKTANPAKICVWKILRSGKNFT